MNVASFTLVANTAQLALTGKYVIRSISYTNGAAGVFTAWDNASTNATQANNAYDNRVQTDPYTRTTTNDDLAGNSNTYDYEGVSDANNTVAANPTYALPILATLATPAAGTVDTTVRLLTVKGLVLKSTVNATAVIEYELAN